jgi:hypothetical protein
MSNHEDQMTISRRDWVLFLLALREASEPLDPVRIQSGMFVLSHDLDFGGEQTYVFQLVDAAPYSPLVSADLEALEEDGLVARHMVAGYTWSEFTATPAGLERAELLIEHMSAPELDLLRRISRLKREELRLGFRDLMEYVHANYQMPTRKPVLG